VPQTSSYDTSEAKHIFTQLRITLGKKKRQFGFVTTKLQAYNILISKRKIHKTWCKNTKKGRWRITGVNFRIPIHVKATLDAALAHDGGGVTGPATQMSVSTSEPNKRL